MGAVKISIEIKMLAVGEILCKKSSLVEAAEKYNISISYLSHMFNKAKRSLSTASDLSDEIFENGKLLAEVNEVKKRILKIEEKIKTN